MSEDQAARESEQTTGTGAPEQPQTQSAEAAGEPHWERLLEDARSKADEHWNQLLRMQAELENFRRRAERDVENAHKFGLEKFALELLPVRDSLEMGLGAAGGDDERLAKLREGMELTLRMLTNAMAKFGIQEVAAQGEPFNPERHQAMTLQESAEMPPNRVLTVLQRGYLINDRLLRPAMVIVSKAPAGS